MKVLSSEQVIGKRYLDNNSLFKNVISSLVTEVLLGSELSWFISSYHAENKVLTEAKVGYLSLDAVNTH